MIKLLKISIFIVIVTAHSILDHDPAGVDLDDWVSEYKNSEAIHGAINYANYTVDGDNTVLIPEGVWHVMPIRSQVGLNNIVIILEGTLKLSKHHLHYSPQ